MDVEVVVCSSSGKPIYHYRKPVPSACFQALGGSSAADDEALAASESGGSHSFVSSLQGLISFVNCMQHDDLQEIETEGCRCVFHTVDDILSYAVIVREEEGGRVPTLHRRCLRRLLALLDTQIVFVLSNRGLDVLRKQPGYDLRELLIGTERVVHGLSTKWLVHPAFRFKDMGVPFLRLHPEDRVEITQTILYEPSQSAEAREMICGVLLAAGKAVAIAQPNRKQFSILVDDLLLLMNFIDETPSFTKSETWMPVCLPSFNASGFLHAYVSFLTCEISLVMLSTQQSPEQFHHFQAKRVFIEQRLKSSGALDRINESLARQAAWRPHRDFPLMHHFVYKNEVTGECTAPFLEAPFACDTDDVDEGDCSNEGDAAMLAQLMDHYARLQHRMDNVDTLSGDTQVLGKRLSSLHDRLAARVVMHTTRTALYMGMCSDDHRLFVWFDALASASPDAAARLQEQCQVLLDRLKRDDELMSVSLFGSSASLWP